MNESQGRAAPLGGSPELERQVDRFEEAWQHGPPPRIEAFLPPAGAEPADTSGRRELLEELVAIDLEYRWRRAAPTHSDRPPAGDLPTRPRLEDYIARYAELGPLDRLPVSLIGEEYRVRHQWGDHPGQAEYVRRFPRHGKALEEALARLDTDLAGERGAPDSSPAPSAVSCPACGKTFMPAAPATWKDGAAPLPARETPAAPPGLTDYEILGELGRGGMGIVYKARDRRLDRLVALKVIRHAEDADSSDLARFRREAEAVARLQHPNIVQIYALGEQAGRPYCALEFVAGRSLAQELAGVPQPPRLAAQLVEVLARAMHYAHERGVVHRDLKPANILLVSGGVGRGEWSKTGADTNRPSTTHHSPLTTPKITDFGLAKRLDQGAGQTQSGSILGTPSYMAPEQAAGRTAAVGPAADVYALGAILYEALTGRPPFKGETVWDTLDQVQSQEPVPPRRLQPKVPRDLETICLKCLQKRVPQRYAGAEALAEDLRRFLAGEPIHARPAGLWERGVKWARRRPAAATAVAVSGLAALLLVAGGVWSNAALRAAAERERHEAQQARLQQQHAVANFRLALDAVEQCYTQLSKDPRLLQAGLEPTRRQLLQTALNYYEKFVKEHGEDQELPYDLAQAYRRLGDIYCLLGAADQGVRHYQSALEVWSRLRDRPDGPPPESERVTLYTHLGQAWLSTGQPDQATAAFAQAQAITEQLARTQPGLVAHQHELEAGYLNLGDWYARHGQEPEAEAAFRRALDLWESLIRADPDMPRYRLALADAYNAAGARYRQQHQPGKAEQAYAQARTIQEQLVTAHPDVADFRSGLAATHQNLGLVYQDQWLARGQAEAAFRKALELYDGLVHDYPDGLRFQKARVVIYRNLGAFYAASGRGTRDKAEAAYRRAVDLLEELARAHPDDLDIPYWRGTVYHHLGLLAKGHGEHSAALDWQTKAVETLAKVWRQEPQHAEFRSALRDAHIERAKLLTAYLGRGADALPDWEWALELDDQGKYRETLLLQRAIAWARVGNHARATAEAKALAERPSAAPGDLYDLACVYAVSRAALDGDAKLTVAERDRLAEQYGGRAMELLARVRAAHYFDRPAERAHLGKDPDLASLRSRADFRKLLAEVGAGDQPSAR